MNYHAPILDSGEATEAMNDNLTPKAIVAALDEHIIGQTDAKRAVAVALRNRWRRQRLGADLRDEVTPKNILMIGPTGCGKTEISRRLAKLADAPFVKVEATKFTEVGYVGRDVEQIARDLVEEAIRLEKERRREKVREAAEGGDGPAAQGAGRQGLSEATRASFRQRITERHWTRPRSRSRSRRHPMPFDIPAGGGIGMINLSEMMGKALGGPPKKRRKLKVPEAGTSWSRKRPTSGSIRTMSPASRWPMPRPTGSSSSTRSTRSRSAMCAADRSVARACSAICLPLIEGTTVATKYGPMKTDHVLFIASGAFHVAKPTDLLPELQGRLPIRVELSALTEADFVRIRQRRRANLVEQYSALLATEEVTLDFTDDAIAAIARIAAQVNETVENIGARRLQTVMERLLEEISFTAEDRAGETLVIDAAFVEGQLSDIAKNADLSRYVL